MLSYEERIAKIAQMDVVMRVMAAEIERRQHEAEKANMIARLQAWDAANAAATKPVAPAAPPKPLPMVGVHNRITNPSPAPERRFDIYNGGKLPMDGFWRL